MKQSIYIFSFVLFLTGCRSAQEQVQTPDKRLVIIGYVPGFRGELDEKTINANKLTHINYAFVDVKDSMAWLTNIETDTINFRRLNNLKRDNPDLKIIISIGGWAWSENFSDAVLTETSREKFASSAVQIVKQYDLDGVDIDWEYPGMPGEDNVYRPEDKQNFTLMFKSLREKLDELKVEKNKPYFLTTAVCGYQECIDHMEIDKAVHYLDYVNIMTYDFYVEGEVAGHHTNLFFSESENELSADKAVKNYKKAGVPTNKIVIGIAFYGRSWIMNSSDNHGLNRSVKTVVEGAGYSVIKDSMVNQKGFTSYWDDRAKAPYLFNDQTNQLVSFDDERSVKHKCQYVKDNGLAGVMFWEYSSDPKEYLLNAIHENMK